MTLSPARILPFFLRLLFVAIVLSAGAAFGQSGQELLNKGHDYYNKDHVDSARMTYQLVVEIDTPDVQLQGYTSLIKVAINDQDFAGADALAAVADKIAAGDVDYLTLANYQRMKAKGWTLNGRYKIGLDTLKAVAALLGENGDPREHGQALGDIAVTYKNMYEVDSSLLYIDRAYEILRGALDLDSPDLGYFYNDIGTVYIGAGKLVEAEEFLNKAIQYLRDHGEANGQRMSMTLGNLGVIYFDQGKYTASQEVQLKALNFARSMGLEDEVARSLFNLGVSHYSIGSFGTAVQYVEEAIRIRENLYGKGHPSIINSYYAISLIRSLDGDHQRAIADFHELVGMTRRAVGPENNQVANYLSTIATSYYKLGVLDSAAYYHRESIRMFEKKNPGGHPDLARAIDYYSVTLAAQEEFPTALEQSRKSVAMMRKFGLNQGREYAIFLANQAVLLAKVGEFAESDQRCKEALTLIKPDENYLLGLESNDVLAILINAAFERYQRNPTSAKLADFKALEHDYLDITEQVRRQFKDPYTKSMLSAGREVFFRNTLSQYVTLYQSEPKEDVLQRIYELAELNKANGLRDQLRTGVNNYRGVPDSIVTQLGDLQEEIEELYYAVGDAGPATYDSLNQALLDARLQFNTVQQKMALDFPDYYRLVFSTEVPARPQVQSQLGEQGEVAVLYFRGQDRYHALVIGPSTTKLITCGDLQTTDRLIAEWREALTSVLTDRHLAIGHQLYQHLWEPLEGELATDRVKIIPEGPLQSIPFAALSTTADMANYLLANKTISYAYSLTLFLQQQGEAADKRVAGVTSIAPGFSEQLKSTYLASLDTSATPDAGYLSTLSQPWSVRLADRIRHAYQGETLVEEAATESGVKRVISNISGVLVFATHGLVNATAPLQSRLQLAKTEEADGEDGYLSVAEIFGQRIPAELSILGVCESGVGKYTSGEGQLSLAYGFSYAGCGSTVNTLWPVDNKTNSEIIDLFLAQLANGVPRAEALRRAQLEFLATAGVDEQHPFYWAGMIAQGKDGVVEIPTRNLWWWVYGLGIVSVFFLGGLYRWRR